jgi:hypothetical protein
VCITEYLPKAMRNWHYNNDLLHSYLLIKGEMLHEHGDINDRAFEKNICTLCGENSVLYVEGKQLFYYSLPGHIERAVCVDCAEPYFGNETTGKKDTVDEEDINDPDYVPEEEETDDSSTDEDEDEDEDDASEADEDEDASEDEDESASEDEDESASEDEDESASEADASEADASEADASEVEADASEVEIVANNLAEAGADEADASVAEPDEVELDLEKVFACPGCDYEWRDGWRHGWKAAMKRVKQLTQSRPNPPGCDNCGVMCKLKKCSGKCGGAVNYCSTTCQAMHWQEEHKNTCRKN